MRGRGIPRRVAHQLGGSALALVVGACATAGPAAVTPDPHPTGVTIVVPTDFPPSETQSLDRPGGITLANDGALIVSDTRHDRILILEADGRVRRVIRATGGEPSTFDSPTGIAVAPDGSFWVADTQNSRLVHLSSDGAPLGTAGGPGLERGEFRQPVGVAIEPNGAIYVLDTNNQRLVRLDADGAFSAMWETTQDPLDNRLGARGLNAFRFPQGIAVAPGGDLLVADTGGFKVIRIHRDGSWAGFWGRQGCQPGQYLGPTGVGVDGSGNVFVLDSGNHRIQRLTASMNVVAIAGSEGIGLGQFQSPDAMVVQLDGTAWVADTGNDRLVRIAPDSSLWRSPAAPPIETPKTSGLRTCY